ncbi:MAG: hypothetical protein JWM93_3102 [Frankiales bacterium]|nr:hypothetical protein [Frankiales bacterium]
MPTDRLHPGRPDLSDSAGDRILTGMAKKRGERLGQLKLAFDIARETDPKLPLWMGLTFLGVTAVFVGIGISMGGVSALIFWIIMGLTLAVLATMMLLSRKVNGAVFSQLDGQPDAAARVLSSMRGAWTVNPGVGVDREQNLVHRVVGRCGVVLVAEGRSATRMKALLVAEKRRVARVAAETPVYEVIVGEENGQVPLKKLQNHVQKLPRNLRPAQVRALAARMRALNSTPPMPKGPLPTGRMPRNRIR